MVDTSTMVALGSGVLIAWVGWRIWNGIPALPHASQLITDLRTTLVPDDYRNKIGRANASFTGERTLTYRPKSIIDLDGQTKDFVTEYQVQGVYKDGPIADRDIPKQRPRGSWKDTLKTASFLNSLERSKFARWK